VAEAGFFPGIIYYLTNWSPASQRARQIGLFMTAIPISTAVGGPLSSMILSLDGTLGFAGWQWMFFIETIPSLILSIVTLKFLLDTPAEAKWLTDEEKSWLIQTLETKKVNRRTQNGMSVVKALTNPRVIILSFSYMGVQLSVYGVILWLPQIYQHSGIAPGMVGYAVTVPYAMAAMVMVWWSRHSDRLQERVWHIMTASLVGFLGLVISATVPDSPLLLVVAITFSTIGTLAILPIFWTISTSFLTGSAAAGGIALINAFGHIGSFTGPFIIGWINDVTGSFTYGLLAISSGVHQKMREQAFLWRANYHPDGGQLFYPLHGQSFVVPLALPGDDVTPESFITFWCDGSRGLYIHPNIWHGAIVPHDDSAEFLDRQGRVHARVSVNFVKEFGCYLAAPLSESVANCAGSNRTEKENLKL
jgi:MFS family permease